MGVILFFLLATVCVAAVVAMIVTRNQAYSALYLVLAFAALGGLFGLLDAPFIAAVQIIIYAGAIMVLFIFVIMLVNLEMGVPPERKKWAVVLASVLGVVLLAELLLAVRWTLFEFGSTGGEKIGRPVTIGRLLYTEYLYPFEITSILIVAALVGAIVLAKKERPTE
jgi:NADH-quinone oxidoreductase subunit J